MAKGGKRPGAGRKPGIANEAHRLIENAITQSDVDKALGVLRFAMSRKAKNIKAAVSASTYILDQKFGKARQSVDLSSNGKPILVKIDTGK